MPFISVLENVNTELVCEQRFSWLSPLNAHITKHTYESLEIPPSNAVTMKVQQHNSKM